MGKRSTQLTMKDIARQMGTSVSTVSRALKDSPRISPERRAEIQAFAREHNFIPNALAGTLRHSKVEPQKTIGVVVPEIVHYYFASIISGIVEKASAEGFLVMVNQSCESYEREVTLCNNFYKYKVCGLIVVQAKDTKKYAHFTQYVENDMPIVFCDRICTGVDASRVVPDDIAICGFTNSNRSTACDPMLTTVEQRGHVMGMEAADILISQVKGTLSIEKVEKRVVRTQLIVRGSTL